MSPLLYTFAAMALLAALLGSISIWSPRRLWLKTSALATLALLLPVTYIGLAELLSRPKPMHLEWHQGGLEEATVVGVELRENQAIYVWLRIEGVADPRSYMLPWDQRRAEELYDAQRQAEANGTEVRLRQPFESAVEDEEPVFYALPQQPLPAKQTPGGGFARISY